MMTPEACGAVLRALVEADEIYSHHGNVCRRDSTNAAMVAELSKALGAKIVCLCGSTRFGKAFADANLRETLAGNIVLTVGSMTHSDAELGALITPEVKAELDALHKKKIDLADEVLVLNVDGYVGESTRSEIEHAVVTGKPVRYLVPR